MGTIGTTTISIILYIWLLAVQIKGHQITVTNRCPQQIWVGTFGDNEIPANGGFPLGQGQSKTFGVRNNWTSGRIWGRTGCDGSGRNCESGDCGAGQCRGRTTFDAVTLAEFGLDKWQGLDFWDISLVDGFNLPMSINPVAGTIQNDEKCRPVRCNFNMGVCPNQWKQWGRGGRVAGCKSACSATRQDKFCCPGWKGYNENNCPNPSWETNVFKNQCRDAYSYAFDDKTSLFACKSRTPFSSSYVVTFCP